MKKLSILTTFLISLFNVLSLFAQNSSLEDADRLFNKFDYLKAAEIYKKKLATNADLVNVKIKLAECYRLVKQPAQAEYWYKEVVNLPNVDPIYTYYYGMALKSNGKYEEARHAFEEYSQLNPGDTRGRRQFEACQRSNELLTDLGIYKVQPVNINTKAADFGAIFYKKGIVFATENTKSGGRVYERTNQPYLDLYYAEIIGNNPATLANISEFGKKINTKWHESNAAFTNDGKTVYYSTNNYESDKKKLNINNLHIIKASGSDFTELSPFAYNSDNYSVGHPALSPDNNLLYFSSNMPGSYGGTDIYLCRKTDSGEWSEPENLGPKINTEGDEMFPFISNNGTLYFASDGQPGLGGLDIFSVSGKPDGSWGSVQNLHYPINSNGDDFSLIIDDASGKGYFSSDRVGGKGSDDIYTFSKSAAALPNECEIKGRIYEKSNNQSVSKATVTLINLKMHEEETFVTEDDGKYAFKVAPDQDYIIYASKQFYLTEVKSVSTKGRSCTSSIQQDLILDIAITKIPGIDPNTGKLDKPIVIKDDGSTSESDLPLPKINKIYYDLDKYYIRPDAEIELDKIVAFMLDNQGISIHLVSHTDSRGTSEYNQQLSEKRAKAAVEYIISKGVEGRYLSYEGKGENQLVNRCKDGVTCSDSEHQQNRRTEFIITGYSK